MAWTTPTSRSTGNLITASIWNTDLVDNLVYLKGRTDLFTFVYKSADESLNTSTTLQNDNDLVVAVAANSIYQWEMTLYLVAAAAGATMDFKCAWSLPASATGYWGAYADPQNFTTYQFSGWQTVATTIGGLAAMESATTISFAMHDTAVTGIKLSGLFRNSSTAGNMQFQWAQNTSNANNLTVKKDSSLIAYKIA